MNTPVRQKMPEPDNPNDTYLVVLEDDVYAEIEDIVIAEMPPVYQQSVSSTTDTCEHTAVYQDSDLNHRPRLSLLHRFILLLRRLCQLAR